MATLPTALALTNIADGSPMVAADVRNSMTAIQTDMNALLTILGGGTNAQVLQSGGGTTVSWAGAYSAYTPTWTATGTAPAIGNAVVTAQYLQLGKMVHAYGLITFGSTSTYGTGNYRFALPVPAAGTNTYLGSGAIFDNSAGFFGQPVPGIAAPATMGFTYGATYLGTVTSLGQTTPWTWAVSDQIGWNITYEAA